MFDIGKRIRKIRKLNNMTMSKLAAKINITQPQLSRIENNINMAQFDTVFAICQVFNITLADFFAPEGTSEPLTDDLKELVHNAKNLTPEQRKQLSKFLRLMTEE